MKKALLALLPSCAFAVPELVYEPPKVMKFEVPFYIGQNLKTGSYHAKAGIDFRAGYPFLVGVFYAKEEGSDFLGLRAKVRMAVAGKLKVDAGVGGLYVRGSYGKKGSGTAEVEALYFIKGGFSLRLSGAYLFGFEEVKGWRISAGFGF